MKYMDAKVLSILIPAYNAQSYLRRCLDSLIKSKHLNKLDVLVVDDGSTDDTADIVEKYVLNYPDSIRLIRKENGNVGSVYNVGFKECKGRYCKELDADDWVETNGLDRLIEMLEESECDLVLNSFETVDENGCTVKTTEPFKTKNKKYDEVLLMSEYGDSIAPAMHAYTYKTDILNDLPVAFDENCYHVDLEYTTFPMIRCRTFIAYHFPVYKYLLGRDDQSMSGRSLIKNIDQHIKVFLRCVDYYETYLTEMPGTDRQIFDRMCGALSALFRICFSMIDRDDSIEKISFIIGKLRTEQPSFYKKTDSRIQEKLIYLTFRLDQFHYCFYDLLKFLLKKTKKLY